MYYHSYLSTGKPREFEEFSSSRLERECIKCELWPEFTLEEGINMCTKYHVPYGGGMTSNVFFTQR